MIFRGEDSFMTSASQLFLVLNVMASGKLPALSAGRWPLWEGASVTAPAKAADLQQLLRFHCCHCFVQKLCKFQRSKKETEQFTKLCTHSPFRFNSYPIVTPSLLFLPDDI